MKKFLVTLIFICSCTTTVFSQDTAILQSNSHEIGLDATPLLQQFLPFGPGSSGIEPYYLTYRYHFGQWALRAGIGGGYRSEQNTINDTMTNESDQSLLEFRVGLERKIEFAKRWQFFYGIDLWTSISKNVSETRYNEKRSLNFDEQRKRYGAAPLLGFRFKINERISLTTESRFQLNYFTGHNIRSYTPEDFRNHTLTFEGFGTEFSPPTSVFLTFNF